MKNSDSLNTESLRAQRCLVLGASGFIGTNLCLALKGRVKAVRAFSRHMNTIEGVEVFQGDFLNEEDLIRAVRDIDVVFHLVSTNTPASSNASPILDAQQNIIQTLQLLEACRASNVRRVVFVSSGGTVYGDASVIPTPEGSLEQPISAYGISKLAIEKYLALYERLYGISTVSLRVSNPYGPYQYARKQQGVIGAFISKSLRGENIEIWGDGSIIRDYIYIDDVVGALIKAITYKGDLRVFNVGSGVGVSLVDIVAILSEVLGDNLHLTYKGARGVDVSKSILDCTLAKTELDWTPFVDIRSGILKTLAWFKNS
ncbi:NAD-dependent epimerase/dehydratase family protein [Pseudomonas sp. B21-054]|uniref:NAD-dependent epimerase/dehydratase family protein n=1 Tax=Pseudomonas sp. B21-054 TaxID=2895494 RepID=UPI0022311280|nr:NAD-dependent epimerase/dehydratase family protein [Pseudomonas sp. B21-054]UZE19659.1 NAD-dependent epimerase/dehydratase family protein [Pseudomonas sp. B21-054]